MSQSVFNSILFSRRSPLFQLHSFVIFCFVRWQPCTVVGHLSRFYYRFFFSTKKRGQVASCFILTSYNFNCFKNNCFWFYKIARKKVAFNTNYGLNVSTTPLRQWGFRQCLPFSSTTLRGKHCQHPIAIMGVLDIFGQCMTSFQLDNTKR